MFNLEAKEQLLKVANEHPTRACMNFEELLRLAQCIADADNVHLCINPMNAEQAAKKALGVD